MSIPTTCKDCGSRLEPVTKSKLDTLDLVGVIIVGMFVLDILGVFMFSSRGFRFAALVGGFVAFGLYYMVGISKKEVLKCVQCGQEVSAPGHSQPIPKVNRDAP